MGPGLHRFSFGERACVTEAPPEAGSILFGHRILRRIGQGTGSVVYAVKDDRGRRYAMKHVTCDADGDVRFLEQFKREHAVGQAIDHESFRSTIALHVRRNLLGRVREAALVLEFVDGHPARPPMTDISDATRLIHKVSQALGVLHSSGFVHCNLKPQNILIQPEGRVRLIGLGQAHPLGIVQDRHLAIDDLHSPEHKRGQTVTAKTDVYGLGALAYCLLSGRAPKTVFSLNNSKSGVLADGPIPSPRQLRRDVPAPLSELVMECLRTSPLQRPALPLVVHRLQLIRLRMQRGVYARACA